MSIDVNECQQQYKEVMETQQRQKEQLEDTELVGDDFSVATPEVTYTRGDEDNNVTTAGN